MPSRYDPGTRGATLLLLYFLWRNGEPRSAIGWEFSRLGRELILGALLFLSIGLRAPSTPLPELGAANLAQAVLGVVLVAVVAWAEEIIFRGYLILRLQALPGRPHDHAFPPGYREHRHPALLPEGEQMRPAALVRAS